MYDAFSRSLISEPHSAVGSISLGQAGEVSHVIVQVGEEGGELSTGASAVTGGAACTATDADELALHKVLFVEFLFERAPLLEAFVLVSDRLVESFLHLLLESSFQMEDLAGLAVPLATARWEIELVRRVL